LTEKAKVEFGDEFSLRFSYIKDGEQKVLSKACSIAKQYRRLKGMQDLDDW
jgi:hypothetical protein